MQKCRLHETDERPPLRVGCHLSASGGYLAMAQTAVSIGANVFQFFTRNPRGGAAKPIDRADVAAFTEYAGANGIGPILAHAPYTLNAAGSEARVREFAESVMADDLRRLEFTPGAMYNFHPGSHVGQGIEAGIGLIASHLVRVIAATTKGGHPLSTVILLETMSGKGSEVGGTFEEIRAIIDAAEPQLPVASSFGVCLDTCHVWDGGYDIVGDLDGVLAEFDRVVGLGRLKAIHVNDSMNVRGSHKDRHEKIGKGKIGLEAFRRIVSHPALRGIPFYLETPCDLQGYREEIALLKELAL
ncbi:MAG: deoxyribonuclease IV [Kiritimatiellae bacterium]|nr:deoxyribonuclease IV [Kiritimatiellia bacterium]